MRTRTLRAAVCVLAAGLAVTVSPSAAAGDAAVTGDHAEVQRVLDKTVADGMPGIIADIRDGRRSWFGAAGMADTETGRERQPQDHFRVGSVNKSFTSTVVLKLAAERRLSLDDTVEKWLPGVVKGNGHDGSKITIRQLLNHTSGIFPYTLDKRLIANYFTPGFFEHRFDNYRPEQLVQIAMANPADFPPGTGWFYSNTNYVLAGMIIEKVTSSSYADEVKRVIIRPLGLTETSLPGTETTLPKPYARHYSSLWAAEPVTKVYDTTDMNASWAWAVGGIVSTAGDLQKFHRALLGGHLLPPAQQKELLTTVSTDGGGWIPNTRYGLGVFSQKLSCGVTAWGGGGMIHGSWTSAMGSRDGKRMIVTNVNGDWGNQLDTLTKVMEAELCPPAS